MHSLIFIGIQAELQKAAIREQNPSYRDNSINIISLHDINKDTPPRRSGPEPTHAFPSSRRTYTLERRRGGLKLDGFGAKENQQEGGGRLQRFSARGASGSCSCSAVSTKRTTWSRGSTPTFGAGIVQRSASHCSCCHLAPGAAPRAVLWMVNPGCAKRSDRCITRRNALTQMNSVSHRRWCCMTIIGRVAPSWGRAASDGLFNFMIRIGPVKRDKRLCTTESRLVTEA